jgi:hypothetical protein
MDMLRKLTKNGYVSTTLLNNYHIFKVYSNMKEPSKMNRYRTVARETNSSVVKVRKAVSDMKGYVKD